MKNRFLTLLLVCILATVCLFVLSACNDGSTPADTGANGENTDSNNVPDNTDPCADGHTEAILAGKQATCLATGLTEGKYCSVCNVVLAAQTETPIADHDYGNWLVTTPMTCESAGLEMKTCRTCKEIQLREIPAPGHAFGEWEILSTLDCETKGEEQRICSTCQEKEIREFPATGHTYGNWVLSVAATCETKGEEYRICSTCNNKQIQELPALGHTFGEWTVTALTTCETKGEEIRICSTCEDKQTREIPALGHAWGEWQETVAVSCETKGEAYRICSACRKEQLRETPALGHAWGEWEVGAQVSCETDGETSRVCSVCQYKQTVEIAALGHAWGEWQETKAPTITENGEKRRTCANCQGFETEVIPMLVHNHDEWEVIILPAAAPSCTENGATAGKKCSGCDTVLEAQEIIPATGHLWSEWKITKPVTCEENGSRTRACPTCGESETEVLLAEDNHIWSESTVTVPVSCTADGTSSKTCTLCQKTVTEAIPATGHTECEEPVINDPPTCNRLGVSAWVCEVCGEITRTETYTYAAHTKPASYDHATCTEDGFYHCTVCGEKQIEKATGHNVLTAVVEKNCVHYKYSYSYCANENCSLPSASVVLIDGVEYDVTVAGSSLNQRLPVCLVGEVEVDVEGGLDTDPNHIYSQESMPPSSPTCTEAGIRIYYCRFCRGQIAEQIEPALGHNMVIDTSVGTDGVVLPDCGTDGYTAFACTRCDHTEKRNVVEKADHAWGTAQTVAATCKSAGYRVHSCIVCGEVEIFERIPFEAKSEYTMDELADAHPKATFVGVESEGSCEEKGYDKYHCPDCNTDLFVIKEGTGLGHKMPAGAVIPNPTCTEDATLDYDCEKCSEQVREVFSALGHNYENHICTRCGAPDGDD